MAYFTVDNENLYVKYRDQSFAFSIQNTSIDAIKSFMRDVHFNDSSLLEFANTNSVVKMMYEDGFLEIKKDTWENEQHYMTTFDCELKNNINAYVIYNILK